jgi:hypothetical protein
VNKTVAIVVSRKAPTKSVRTEAQVAAPPPDGAEDHRGIERQRTPAQALKLRLQHTRSGFVGACERLVQQLGAIGHAGKPGGKDVQQRRDTR